MLICPWSIVQQKILFWIWQLAKFSTQRLCDYLGFGFSTIRWNAIWTSASPYSGYKRNEFYDSRCPHAEAGCCWKGTNHSFYIEGEFLIFVKWKRERMRGDKGQEVMFKNQQGSRWFLMTAKTKKNGILDVCMQAKEIGTRRYKLVSRRTHLIV